MGIKPHVVIYRHIIRGFVEISRWEDEQKKPFEWKKPEEAEARKEIEEELGMCLRKYEKKKKKIEREQGNTETTPTKKDKEKRRQ